MRTTKLPKWVRRMQIEDELVKEGIPRYDAIKILEKHTLKSIQQVLKNKQ